MLYLCTDILGYRDVCLDVHGPIIELVQKFPLPPPELIHGADIFQGGRFQYTPWMNPYKMPGKRRRLLLDPRGGLKTTINCMAHLIQWILNYPHLAYLMVQSNTPKAQDILKEIKGHFQYNQIFRDIFPDYCPQKRVSDWGNREEFTVENQRSILQRMKLPPRRESTLMASSIDKGTAGYHFDVMKFSDIVEPQNVKTDSQILDVVSMFHIMENLLVQPSGWIDVEGTRYHGMDLYGDIIKKWETDETGLYRDKWDIHVRSCWVRDFAGEKPYYTPDSLRLPFKLDEQGHEVSHWPDRFTYEWLKAQEHEDPYAFATQRLNDPRLISGYSEPFPDAYMQWIDRKDFVKIPLAFHTVTVDTAETQNRRSNFSVVTVCGWDNMGRCYVHDVRYGKFLPDELINHIFDVYIKYNPLLVRIEETSFVRGLKSSIYRVRDKLNVVPNFDFIKRETAVSKTERILNTLQPWYKSKEIRFLTDLKCKYQIIHEFKDFPGGGDDFLDTLADQFQNREYFGRLKTRPQKELLTATRNVNDPGGHASRAQRNAYALWINDPDSMQPTEIGYDPHNARTGGL